jgi:hypothetical protein
LTSYAGWEKIAMSRWAPVHAFVARARAAVERLIATTDHRAGQPVRVAPTEWVDVETDVPAALGALFQDVLSQAGIPVMLRDAGGTLGRGALGGVPTNIRVLVPAERAAEAHELLDSDGANSGEGVGDGRDDGEESR